MRVSTSIRAATFIRRSCLGLEPDWEVDHEFTRMWDSRFQTYRVWEKCKLRDLYLENWIGWTERGKARRIEAFRFLESELRNSTLTLTAPGDLSWWEDDARSLEHAPMLIEKKSHRNSTRSLRCHHRLRGRDLRRSVIRNAPRKRQRIARDEPRNT